MPAVFNLSKDKKWNIVIAVAHGPSPATGLAPTAFSWYKKGCTEFNYPVHVLMGDFNLSEKKSGVFGQFSFKNADVIKASTGLDENFIWVGDHGGTTFIRKDGEKAKLSGNPRDRVYINRVQCPADNWGSSYSLSVDYDRDEDVAQFTDHVLVHLNFNPSVTVTQVLETVHVLPKQLDGKVSSSLYVQQVEAITFDVLISRFEQQIKSNGYFILNDATLGTENLDVLIRQSFFLGDTEYLSVNYQGDITASNGNQLTISGGSCSIFRTSPMDAVVELWLENGQVSFLLQARPGNNWRLEEYFPEIKESELGQIAYQNSLLVFSTGNIPSAEPESKDYVLGLNFLTQCNFPSNSSGFDSFPYNEFPDFMQGPLSSKNINMQGVIVHTSQGVVVDLTGDIGSITIPVSGAAVALGSASIQIIYNPFNDNTLSYNDEARSETGLFAGGGVPLSKISIFSQTRLQGNDLFILCFGNEESPVASLEDLVSLFGNIPIPNNFLQNFTLENLTIAMMNQDNNWIITFIESSVALQDTLEIMEVFGNSIQLDQSSVRIIKGISDQPSWSISLDANLKVADGFEFEMEIIVYNSSLEQATGSLTITDGLLKLSDVASKLFNSSEVTT